MPAHDSHDISKQTDSVFMDPSPTPSALQMKKNLPPIATDSISAINAGKQKSSINVMKNSSITLK